MSKENETIVPKLQVHSFIVRCLESVGLKSHHASVLADLMVAADYRGHYSHGLNMLDFYMKELKSGLVSMADNEPTIVKQSVGTALVDGNNLIGDRLPMGEKMRAWVPDIDKNKSNLLQILEVCKGHGAGIMSRFRQRPYVGRFCMDLAIEKAKTAGIGIVSCRGSNHFGIAGWYSIRAMAQGFLGMAFCNTTPLMIPTRGTQVAFGTNPLSLAAPATKGDSYVLDMATTTVAEGKCRLKDVMGEPLPSGWATDESGNETHAYKDIFALMPLGGKEESSGYKGYGLAMMVEKLCGILSGGDFGPFVRDRRNFEKPANKGQCFIAIDPTQFEDGFTDRMQTLIDACRNQTPVTAKACARDRLQLAVKADKDPVLIPGDPERQHMEFCDNLGGIPYSQSQINFVNETTTPYKLEPLKKL